MLIHRYADAVRYTDLDAYGHVNNAVHLRYWHEAAFSASLAAGFDLAAWRARNLTWFIRETEIDYHKPLIYPGTVTIETWISQRGSSWFKRQYVARDAAGEAVTEGWSLWACLTASDGRPARLPADVIAAFCDAEVAQLAPPDRDRFPTPPPPAPVIFRHPRVVDFRDTDTVGHVNNATYVSYIGECAWAVSAHFGWDDARLRATGAGILARRHRIVYDAEARFGDPLEVHTYGFDRRRVQATRHFRVQTPDGRSVARCNTVYVWVDLKTGRPARWPEAYMRDLAPNLSPAG